MSLGHGYVSVLPILTLNTDWFWNLYETQTGTFVFLFLGVNIKKNKHIFQSFLCLV